MFFQQLKQLHYAMVKRNPEGTEAFFLGAAASAATVALLMPLDTVKTRIVTQVSVGLYLNCSPLRHCFSFARLR
jgi:hypothetical protein